MTVFSDGFNKIDHSLGIVLNHSNIYKVSKVSRNIFYPFKYETLNSAKVTCVYEGRFNALSKGWMFGMQNWSTWTMNRKMEYRKWLVTVSTMNFFSKANISSKLSKKIRNMKKVDSLKHTCVHFEEIHCGRISSES